MQPVYQINGGIKNSAKLDSRTTTQIAYTRRVVIIFAQNRISLVETKLKVLLHKCHTGIVSVALNNKLFIKSLFLSIQFCPE